MQNIKTNTKVFILTGILVLTGSLILYSVLNRADTAGFYDVKYSVEYSPDSTFHFISERYEFYDRVRDKYYLKPEQVQTDYWLGKGTGLYGSNDMRFARIKGIINDSVYYLTKPIEFSGCILSYPREYFHLPKLKGKLKTINQ